MAHDSDSWYLSHVVVLTCFRVALRGCSFKFVDNHRKAINKSGTKS